MTLNLMMPEQNDLKPRITVFGVGGAGGNAVNNMIEKELDGVEFVVANTDAQALQQTRASQRVQMGVKVTEGLGAGARPAVGAAAAEESIEEIVDHLAGAHMCFITAGMGGGTGTGAAPIIAQAARELGVLTVGVVTKPFQFEGGKRMKQAEEGVEALQKVVDTLIIIPNQNLFRLANEKTTFTEAFSMADDVLYQGVKGVTDLMVRPGLINLDFADVRAVMDEMGKAMMGTGEAEGEDRAVQAAEKAIANPLLDEISLRGAKGVLINITGGYDLTLFELDEAANRIREEVDPEANIIVGSTLDTTMEGRMRVSVVATGIDAADVHSEIPVPRRRLSEPLQSGDDAASRAVAEAPLVQNEIPEPVEEEARYEEEPSFFDELDPSEAAAQEQAEDIFADFDEEEAEADELPAPVYRPERAAPSAPPRFSAPQRNAAPTDRPAGDFVAPKPHLGGQAAADPMERVRHAAAARRASAQQGQPRAEPQLEDRTEAAGDRARFGINSLINRMTGHGQEEVRQAGHLRPRPQQAPAQEPELSEEDEKIEIPAFLRRQAN